MSCIVFTLATSPDLEPVTGAAPWSVLARQLPRQLVVCLNGDGDRGARFVPLIGVMDGRRRFLDPVGRITSEVLLRLAADHREGFVVGGELCRDALRLRMLALPAGEECVAVDVPFDPAEPWAALRRAAFELGEPLAAPHPHHGTPDLSAPALAKWLEARDILLSLEANLLGVDGHRTIAAVVAVLELAPASADVHALFRDAAIQLARRGLLDVGVARGIEAALAGPAVPLELVIDCARLVESALGAGSAAELWRRVAVEAGDDPDVLAEASSSLFSAGAVDTVRGILRSAVERGCRDHNLRAQLAAVEDVAGDAARRDRLLEDLWTESQAGLPPKVARLVASWLVDRDLAGDALALLDRCTQRDVRVAGIWLERGRALVALGRVDEARGALRHALELGLSVDGAAECRRLLGLCASPDLVPGMLAIERAVGAGDRTGALAKARRLVRAHRSVAECWILLGSVRETFGQIRRAQRALRRAVALDPGSADAHARLGACLAAQGHAEPGVTHLRHATELSPRDGSLWVQLARVLERAGRRDEALAALGWAAALGAGAQASGADAVPGMRGGAAPADCAE